MVISSRHSNPFADNAGHGSLPTQAIIDYCYFTQYPQWAFLQNNPSPKVNKVKDVF
ncbi:MAG TPA: hypothetical protein VGC75_05860 [Candidatus Nitrosocosmicus sp.]